MVSKPDISHIIEYLSNNLGLTDITLGDPVDVKLLWELENVYRIVLPDDVCQFYQFADGFESVEDIFRIVPIEEIIENVKKPGRLYIAEYMIYSDMWELEINPTNRNEYKIFNTPEFGKKVILTESFAEFLQRFLDAGVFGDGGLYDWQDEIVGK